MLSDHPNVPRNRLPTEGTKAMRVLLDWFGRPMYEITHSQAIGVWCMTGGSRRRAGHSVTNVLKRYGRKQGERCSRTPWKMDPAVVHELSLRGQLIMQESP